MRRLYLLSPASGGGDRRSSQWAVTCFSGQTVNLYHYVYCHHLLYMSK